jgi:hypothetical protein
MYQRLILEGKTEIYAIAEIWKKHFPMPSGFTKRTEKEFAQEENGFEGAITLFEAALFSANINNIGLVIDADFANQNGGVAARWQRVQQVLKKRFPNLEMNSVPSLEGTVLKPNNDITIGIWIMPNNKEEGYLEHFLVQMIEKEDVIYKNALHSVGQLYEKKLLSNWLREKKHHLYTWLAWQQEPGQTFGTAIKKGGLQTENVKSFLNWLNATFLFE